MSGPLVSLVTPAYNQGEFLAETIESVLAQTYAPIDYRVIDDGSTDATAEVLARYAGRVRSERQANIGQVRTLNRGWDEAPGTYLGYLSSDDILYPTAVARAVDVLEAQPEVVCVFPDASTIGPRGQVLQRSICRPFSHGELLVRQDCWIGPGALFRASAYRAVGGWRTDLRIAPDREFWLRLARHGAFHFLGETLAGYRLHPRSISFSETSEEQSREYLRVLDTHFGDGGLPPELQARRGEAYGHAHYVIARNQLRAGRIAAGLRYWREARRLAPETATLRYAARLARAAVGKPLRLAQARLLALFP